MGGGVSGPLGLRRAEAGGDQPGEFLFRARADVRDHFGGGDGADAPAVVEAVAVGETVEEAGAALPILPEPDKPRPTIFHLLTDSELDIVTLTLAGYTTTDIASKMNVEAQTVFGHRHNIKQKALEVLSAEGDGRGTNL